MTAPSDFAADNYYARYDGTEDPDLHDAGEHPAFDLAPFRDAVRTFLYPEPTPAQEMALGTAQEVEELAGTLGGIASMFGYRLTRSDRWWGCWCEDGRHDVHPVFGRVYGDDEQQTRRIAAEHGWHVQRTATFTLTSPAVA